MSTEDLADLIKLAEQEVSKRSSYLSEAKKELNGLKQLWNKEKFGVTIGGMVHCRGKLYKITDVPVLFHPRKPWVKGVRQRPDGTFTRQEFQLYSDWELAETVVVKQGNTDYV